MINKMLKSALLATSVCIGWAGVAHAQSPVGLVSLFADVNGNGAVVNSSGLEKAGHPGVGKYVLFFNREVTNCSIVGSAYGSGGGRLSFQKLSDPKRVRVYARAGNGNLADMRFMTSVTCSP